MAMRIELEQNDQNDRWMWKLKDDKRHICMSGIHGYETQEQAQEAAKHAFSAPVTIKGGYGEEYAGEREFSN